jgi:hypothetical protein
MPRFSQNPGGPAACTQTSSARADSRIAMRLQTERNPCVEQQAALQFAPLLGDFGALSLCCNILAIARAFSLNG